MCERLSSQIIRLKLDVQTSPSLPDAAVERLDVTDVSILWLVHLHVLVSKLIIFSLLSYLSYLLDDALAGVPDPGQEGPRVQVNPQLVVERDDPPEHFLQQEQVRAEDHNYFI